MEANSSASKAPNEGKSNYEKRVSRISKENVFMVLAMWMERSPLPKAVQGKAKAQNEAKPKAANKVGAVLVTAENRLYAMDCTRDGVHAMARLLMKHSQKLKESTIYTSRRPCSFCAKLLVQCGVSTLYYLPTEPEFADDKDLRRVDNILKVARLAHSYFVPYVEDKVAHEKEEKTPYKDRRRVAIFQKTLMKQFWNKNWIVQAAVKLHWAACDRSIMRTQFHKDFNRIMKWISQVTMKAREIKGFVQYPPRSNQEEEQRHLLAMAQIPRPQSNGTEEEQRHLLAMAQILAQRTDDPKRGVGAVIWKEKQIVATGWNGFPAKALYGEFPRASDKDKKASEEQKKYPYIIHAEQNALLMKNTGDISGSTLFVTKPPCHECVPLLKLEGVKECVIGITEQQAENEFKRTSKDETLAYDVFLKEVMEKTFTCYVVKEARSPAVEAVKRKLLLPTEQETSSQETTTASPSEVKRNFFRTQPKRTCKTRAAKRRQSPRHQKSSDSKKKKR